MSSIYIGSVFPYSFENLFHVSLFFGFVPITKCALFPKNPWQNLSIKTDARHIVCQNTEQTMFGIVRSVPMLVNLDS